MIKPKFKYGQFVTIPGVGAGTIRQTKWTGHQWTYDVTVGGGAGTRVRVLRSHWGPAGPAPLESAR